MITTLSMQLDARERNTTAPWFSEEYVGRTGTESGSERRSEAYRVGGGEHQMAARLPADFLLEDVLAPQ